MIKFLHTADLHLDSPFHDLTPQEAVRRRQEQREQLQQIANIANDENCDLVLIAGDLFDSDAVFPETAEILYKSLESIRGRVFIAPGNHDYCSETSPYCTLKYPENTHIFTSKTPTFVHLPHLDCTVYGAAFTANSMAPMLQNFSISGTSGPHIMVLHGDPTTPRSDYNPISKEDIANSSLNYLALGHIHTFSGAKSSGNTTYAHPGCPMGRGFDETGEKGVILGKTDGKSCEISFFPLISRRYEILHIPAGENALASALSALPENTANDLYRIVFTGESDPLDLQALEASLAPRFYSLQLRDETTEKRDIWQDIDDTLRGQFLSLLREKMDAVKGEETAILELAARLGVAAMEGREEVLEW